MSKHFTLRMAAAATLLLGTTWATAQEDDTDVEVDVDVDTDETETPPQTDVDVYTTERTVPTEPMVDPDVPPRPIDEPVAAPVSAPPPPEEDDDFPNALIPYDTDEPDLATGIGMGLTIGGGVTGFVGDTVRSFTDPGGGWDARLTIGTRSLLAAEIGYIGAAQNIEAIGLDNSAVLMTNGVEAALRVNILPGVFQPYILGGGGYTNYNLVNADFNNSALQENDNVAHFPLGGGVGIRYENLLIDLRGIVRPTVEDELFEEMGGGMHSWDAKASAGVEF